jgi:hypothetical protein
MALPGSGVCWPGIDARASIHPPAGKDAPRGLGLGKDQIDAVADFLENGLYDPGFAKAFQPNEADLTYSTNHPELAALGASDGQLLSGLAVDNDDPLSRRDQGLEFLDVTQRVRADRIDTKQSRQAREDVYRLTNISDSVVDTHLLVIVRGLTSRVRLKNASGTTHSGEPYLPSVFSEDGVLEPGERITRRPWLFPTAEAARRASAGVRKHACSIGQGMP